MISALSGHIISVGAGRYLITPRDVQSSIFSGRFVSRQLQTHHERTLVTGEATGEGYAVLHPTG